MRWVEINRDAGKIAVPVCKKPVAEGHGRHTLCEQVQTQSQFSMPTNINLVISESHAFTLAKFAKKKLLYLKICLLD
jgi:hypothetical protein